MNTNTTATPARPPRDYSFDNIKALLIFFVVLGHVLVSGKTHEACSLTYKCIYLFHMPLFVFISGYFSKKAAKSFSYSIHSALVPYVIFALIFKIVECIIFPDKLARLPGSLIDVPFSYWYLLCLFYWRLATPLLAKLKKFALPLTIVLGLLAGFISKGGYLSVARAFAFLPFYWLGFDFNSDTVAFLRKRPVKIALAIALPVVFAGAIFIFRNYTAVNYPNILQMKNSYEACKFSPLEGIGVRAAVYLAATIIILAAISLMPNRKCILSKVGQATMSIYIAHGYIVLYLIREFGLLDGIFNKLGNLTTLAFCVLVSVVITVIFSLPFMVKFFAMLTGWLSDLCKKAFEPKKKEVKEQTEAPKEA